MSNDNDNAPAAAADQGLSKDEDKQDKEVVEKFPPEEEAVGNPSAAGFIS